MVIDKTGAFHVKDQIMTPDALETYLLGVKATNDTDVIVVGDKTAPLQQVMSAMDEARKAGITNVGIATQNP